MPFCECYITGPSDEVSVLSSGSSDLRVLTSGKRSLQIPLQKLRNPAMNKEIPTSDGTRNITYMVENKRKRSLNIPTPLIHIRIVFGFKFCDMINKIKFILNEFQRKKGRTLVNQISMFNRCQRNYVPALMQLMLFISSSKIMLEIVRL